MIKYQNEIDEMITKAKIICNDNYNDSRKWVSTKIKVPAWPSGKFDVELMCKPGSPCKGYIIVNYGTKTVRAFSGQDKILCKLRIEY